MRNARLFRAFTLIELLVVCAIILVLVAILAPALSRGREKAHRGICAGNLKAIVSGFMTYAEENNNTFPATPGPAASQPGTWLSISYYTSPTMSPEQQIATYYGASAERAGYVGSIPETLSLLVLMRQGSLKEFNCPSTPPLSDPSLPSAFYSNYSIAFPWDQPSSNAFCPVGAWWKNTGYSTLPVVADMAPRNAVTDTLDHVTLINVTNAATSNAKTLNSANHRREGQNVGFADGHVEFALRPTVGQSGDNIWTDNGNKGPSATGTAVSIYGTLGNTNYSGGSVPPFDVVFVPTSTN